MGTKQDFGTTVQPPAQRRNGAASGAPPIPVGGGPGQERNSGMTGGSVMGGKAPSAPKQQDPMEAARAQDWLAQQQYSRDQTTKTAADQKAAADKLAAQGYTTQQINQMMGEGGNYLTKQLAQLGYTDTYGIGDRFNELLTGARRNVPGEATDVGKYFDFGDMFKTATAGAQTQQQSKLDTALRSLTPTGWQEKYFSNESDDPILQEILSQQKGDLETTLKRKLDRGQMSQGAYDYALGQEGQLSEGAMANLQNIGGGVLSKYRGQLGDLANAFGADVSGYKLGQNVDTASWQPQLTAKQGQLQGSLKGDILSALGSTQLFDPNALIAKSGSQAGPSNQPVAGSNPQGTGNVPVEEEQRSTGTTGIF